MRFYNQQHQYYSGTDLHARSMYLCILDHAGTILLDQNFPAEAIALRHVIAPYRDGLVVAAGCMFPWYWVADLCRDEGIPSVLGHALYMKMKCHDSKPKIHGRKRRWACEEGKSGRRDLNRTVSDHRFRAATASAEVARFGPTHRIDLYN
jgi:hypothetical protein